MSDVPVPAVPGRRRRKRPGTQFEADCHKLTKSLQRFMLKDRIGKQMTLVVEALPASPTRDEMEAMRKLHLTLHRAARRMSTRSYNIRRKVVPEKKTPFATAFTIGV